MVGREGREDENVKIENEEMVEKWKDRRYFSFTRLFFIRMVEK